MTLARPSKYPLFAQNPDGTSNDVLDSGTGQNNVEEPLDSKKLIGWQPDELPPRNVFNWLHRMTAQWIQYLDETIGGGISGAFGALIAHEESTGTEVHGLGTASIHAETDFAASGALINHANALVSSGVHGMGSAASHAETDFMASGMDQYYARKSNNLSDLTSAVTARTNLGLGTAAVWADSHFATAGALETVIDNVDRLMSVNKNEVLQIGDAGASNQFVTILFPVGSGLTLNNCVLLSAQFSAIPWTDAQTGPVYMLGNGENVSTLNASSSGNLVPTGLYVNRVQNTSAQRYYRLLYRKIS